MKLIQSTEQTFGHCSLPKTEGFLSIMQILWAIYEQTQDKVKKMLSPLLTFSK